MSDTKNTQVNFSAEDFTPVVKKGEQQQISRPSLSYWEDAFIRFKKNKRALASFFIIIALVIFSFIGPIIHSVDFKEVNIDTISKGFASNDEYIVTGDLEMASPIVEMLMVYEIPEKLGKTNELQVLGTANLQSVILKWKPVAGATGYKIFRNEYPPKFVHALGLPLGEIENPNFVSYQDLLKLEPINYYYSVLAVKDGQDSKTYTTIQVTPQRTVSLTAAKSYKKDVKVNERIRLINPLGTDTLGRDVLSRIMRGGQVSLMIGLIAPLCSILIGIIYGGIAGYVGGSIDNVMMRFCDFIISLPFLLFMILIKVALTGNEAGSSGIPAILIALIALGWPATARLVRGQVLQIREEAYIQAARLLGASRIYLIMRHMIPNTMGVILVSFTFAVPGAIFSEAFLSFIGMGVASPETSWGAMCQDGLKSIFTYPHELITPAIFISITVLAFNTFGDGLRDALDSKLRSRE